MNMALVFLSGVLKFCISILEAFLLLCFLSFLTDHFSVATFCCGAVAIVASLILHVPTAMTFVVGVNGTVLHDGCCD